MLSLVFIEDKVIEAIRSLKNFEEALQIGFLPFEQFLQVPEANRWVKN